MKKGIFILLLVCIQSFGQQDSQFTQYMYNTISINPAYAGSREVVSVFGMHRNQWAGLDGAPVTNTFAVHTPIENSNLGIGMSFINDKIGPSEETAISIDLSYTILTSSAYKLAFGLKATGNILNVDFTKLSIYNPGDALGQFNIDNRFTPNFGVGVYYYSNKTYFGLSVPTIFETKHFDKDQPNFSENSIAAERMHYYFMMGSVFDVSSTIKFKPALLSKVLTGAPMQVDVSANFMFHEKLTLGAAYRWDAAGSFLAGFQVSDSWYIGYAYDMEITKLANYNSGSHELFLRYEFTKNKEGVKKSLRLF